MRPILRNLFWAFVVVLLGFAYRACAQEPLCQKTVVDADMHISYEAIPCPVSWRTLPPPHRSWAYRHRKTLIVSGLTVLGVVIGGKLAYHKGCPHMIDGIPYDGTYPCPTECYSLEKCEWGTRRK